MHFIPSRQAMAGVFTPGNTAMRALLKASPLAISIEQRGAGVLRTLELTGVRSEDAWAWMDAATGRPLTRFRFEIADGPGGGSQPFRGEPAVHFKELVAWYADGESLLSEIRKSLAQASSVRCWPHHFDIAFLLPVSRGRGKSKGSIGVGLSPGDENYAQPYWYVTPWPHADRPILPSLPAGGHWHTRGWKGAVLAGSRVVASGRAREQAQASRRFLKSAIDSCKKVIAAASDKP
jgi:hypothetical protein